MRLKFNKSFSLIEVLITVGIVSGVIIFIFRCFAASLGMSLFSQHISLGCYLAEDKLWQIEQAWQNNTEKLPRPGVEKIQDRDFKWDYEISDSDPDATNTTLKNLKLEVSWQENFREKDYSLEFFTTLLAQKK